MADYEFINSTGTVIANTETILSDVQAEYSAAFGSDLIIDPSTPQGVLMTAEALSRTSVVNNNAALANQINPQIAGGIWLDAIMALTGIQRTVATKTFVPNVTLTGSPSTTIPAGTRARTTAGDLFESLSTVIIGAGGTITVDFSSVEYGPIPCPANDLNTVVTSVLGWETVNNATGGVLGADSQSDIGARAYRENTLAFQGVALPVAITSALYATEGVKSVFFQENTAATTQTINGISMVAHSVYACVYGGSDVDVAAALLENKSSGAPWNGSTTVSVVEPASGQTYAVKFDRPAEIGILVKVTTTNGNTANIQSAILAYVNGEISGESGWGVGTDVSPWELAGAISSQYPATFITKVEISYSAVVSYTTNVLAIAINEIAITSLANITVVNV